MQLRCTGWHTKGEHRGRDGMRGSAKREGGKRKRWSGVTGTEEHKQRDKGQREESGSLRVEEEEGETSVCVLQREDVEVRQAAFRKQKQ